MHKKHYDSRRHDVSDAIYAKHGEKLYHKLYGADCKIFRTKRGDPLDLEKGIDAIVSCPGKPDVNVGDRFRPAVTKEGLNLCNLNDMTIRDKEATMVVKDFIYAVENEKGDGLCRWYQFDIQPLLRLHIEKKLKPTLKRKNIDGNWFSAFDIDKLKELNLVKKSGGTKED